MRRKEDEISDVECTDEVTVLTVDQDFFKALGAKIAERRKTLCFTKTDIATVLGCSQAMMASYESGRRRIPVSLLPTLAEKLHLSVGDLFEEEESKVSKRGPKSKFDVAIDRARALSKRDQYAVVNLIDALDVRKKAKAS